MRPLRAWRLRSYLGALLLITTVLTFAVVGTAILTVRIPLLEAEARSRTEHELQVVIGRERLLTESLENQMATLAAALYRLPPQQAQPVLNQASADGRVFRALYLLSRHGLLQASGLPVTERIRQTEFLGSDFSGLPLFKLFTQRQQTLWGDKFLSALTGEVSLALATPLPDGRMLMAELPTDVLLRTLNTELDARAAALGNAVGPQLWIVDAQGDVIADSDHGLAVAKLNLLHTPQLQALRKGELPPTDLDHAGEKFHVATARSPALGWTYMSRTPRGLANTRVSGAITSLTAAFLGTLVVGLMLAPFWASGLVRALRLLMAQSAQVAHNGRRKQWPRGRVVEFNELAHQLEHMADTLQEREKRAQAIFHTSPVAMVVTDLGRGSVFVDINEAWTRFLGHDRVEAVGKSARDIGLWYDLSARQYILENVLQGPVTVETDLNHKNGSHLRFRISARLLETGDQRLVVWAAEDLTDIRNKERELKELNLNLEARVTQRTQALKAANEEISKTVEHLQQTQAELVRSEKMAALGSLVAGVAHELNTPLGNSLMAITTLRDETRQFRTDMQQGLRKSALEQLLESIEQATRISGRNLERAASLVSSFKQVAVDQTSSQRRSFDLREVVDEIVLTLRPSFARTPYQIEVDVPKGFVLDSFPGPLGQVLTNLITNAIVHGFDGRDHGTIRVHGEAGPDDTVLLRVEDDGKGIPPHMIDRIFDPFVTTRMGRGGTGLGLHISYNATTHVLGGALNVSSAEGQGSCFRLKLPRSAPITAGSAEHHDTPQAVVPNSRF